MDPELQRLRSRVEMLEQRLLAVELYLGAAPAPPPPPAPIAPDMPPAAPVSWAEPPPIPAVVPPLPVAPPPLAVADAVETNAGLVWANWIGAITMILGVLFAFKYGVDNEMIGPTGRVLTGILAGIAALAGGDKLWQRRHQMFAQGITSLGIALFYFSFYAAYQLYQLVPKELTFAGTIVTTALAGALALRYDARTIAILALLGGYLSPFLASSNEPNDLFLGAYLFVLNAIALTLARRKQWLSVEIAAALSTLLLFTIWFSSRGSQLTPPYAGFAVLQFVVFALSPFRLIRAAAPVPAMLGVAALCSIYASPMYWTWAGVVVVTDLALAWRERDDRRLLPSLAGWIAGFLVWNPYGAPHGTLFAGLATGFAAYLGVAVFLPMSPRTIATYATLAANGLFFFAACFSWFDADHHGYMGLLALAVAASYLGAAVYFKRAGEPREMLLVSAGGAFSFVTLAIPIQLSGFSITIAWAIESGMLAFLALRFQNYWTLAASWLSGLLALGMLFEDDAGRAWGAEYSPVLNARFLPFMVMTLSLAANAFWTSKMSFVPRALAAVPLLAAHFTLLCGLHLEVFAWIQWGQPMEANLVSQLTFASSFLLAFYGLGLVAQGISAGFRLHRVLGLALFALVVAKLYLFDIWQLDRFYRILAFVVLGGMLLSGSFLYSRYRHRLLAMLQDEKT
jgi:hypothetical protein